MTATVTIYKSRGKQPYRWHLKSANGRILCSGEGHKTPSHARRAVTTVMRAFCEDDLRFVYHTKQKRGRK